MHVHTGPVIVLVLGAFVATAAPPGPATVPDAASAFPPQEVPRDPQDISFASELGVDLAKMELQESGLYIQVLKEGRGPQAARGDRMWINYTVWFPDGSKLDSSLDHRPPTPYEMVLGRTRLIDGWNEGVTGMRRGESRLLVVPYHLAYGERGRPPEVPPYMALVFEVELAEHVPAGGR